jgi:hypothetical protein
MYAYFIARNDFPTKDHRVHATGVERFKVLDRAYELDERNWDWPF